MTYELSTELPVDTADVKPEPLEPDARMGTAAMTLPEGAAGGDTGAIVNPEGDTDAGFGEVDAATASPGQESRRVEIPRQPQGDQAENTLAHDTSVVGGDIPAPQPIDEQPSTQQDKPAPEARSAKPEIPLDIRGNGPWYELLLQEGDAGAALVPYLHRLTVTRDDYCERSQALKHDDGDELEKGLVDRLGDEEGARDCSDAYQLKDILGHSLQELKARPELIEEGEVNWLGLGTALLDRAAALGKGPDFEVRQGILSGAAVAALMSENSDDRITFLEETAARNLSRPMASAVNQSEVSIIFPGYRNTDMRPHSGRDDRSIQRLRNFRSSFQVPPDEIARYRQLVERDFDEPVDAHAAMQDATEGYTSAGSVMESEHGEALEDASVVPSYVDKYRIDPTKAERFALEEEFVSAQMAEVFPGGDTTTFRQELAMRRPHIGDVDTSLLRLLSDAQTVIHEMSAPVAERFKVPTDMPNDSWTREQLVGWRYKHLHGKADAYDSAAKFVDPTIFTRSSNFTENVFDISENGAALPVMAAEALHNVVQLADKFQGATGERLTPEELRDLAQEKRRQLMKLAAINIDHLSASLVNGSIGSALTPGTRRPAALDETEMVRRPNGKLDLTGPLFKTEVASSQAGARLACVALRVNVEGGQEAAEAGARNNKINSIELLSKLVFDEAYERGIFQSALAQAA